MKRLSSDEVQKALSEHTEVTKPSQADTSKQNDYMETPSRWNAPRIIDITAARAAHTSV